VGARCVDGVVTESRDPEHDNSSEDAEDNDDHEQLHQGEAARPDCRR